MATEPNDSKEEADFMIYLGKVACWHRTRTNEGIALRVIKLTLFI